MGRTVRGEIPDEAVPLLGELRGLKRALDVEGVARDALYERRLELFRLLREMEVTHSDIADACGVSPTYIVKALREAGIVVSAD